MDEHIKAKDILGPVLYVQVEDEEGNDHWPEDTTTSATRVNESDVKYIRSDIAQTMIFDLMAHCNYSNLPQDMKTALGRIFVLGEWEGS